MWKMLKGELSKPRQKSVQKEANNHELKDEDAENKSEGLENERSRKETNTSKLSGKIVVERSANWNYASTQG